MLGDAQLDRRQIQNRAALSRHDRRPNIVQGRLAGCAGSGAMRDDDIWLDHPLERLAGVADLPAGLLARLAS